MNNLCIRPIITFTDQAFAMIGSTMAKAGGGDAILREFVTHFIASQYLPHAKVTLHATHHTSPKSHITPHVYTPQITDYRSHLSHTTYKY